MAAPDDADRAERIESRFAWLSVAFGTWIFAGLILWVRALEEGLTDDVGISPYHLPFYLGILGLVLISAGLVVRAARAGRPWRQAFPRGYGGLGVGAVLLLAWPILDLGWREGIGINSPGIEELVAPTRLVLLIGIMLVAAAPLRAALGSARGISYRVPLALSAALFFSIIGGFGGFSPVANVWLESPLSGREDDGELWVMNADGSGQTRLIEAANGYVAGAGVWSPDGSQIAYIWLQRPIRSEPADRVDIWIANADGTDRRPLVEGEAVQWIPHWSPDGTWIVYTIDPPGGPGGAGIEAPAFGFGQGPGVGQPARVAPPVDIWQVRADGTGEAVRLTDDPADDRAGAFSPDGKRLLFDSTREGGRTAVYLMNADGSGVIRATFLGDDWGASWSPDGKRIAFNSSPVPAPSDIYVIDVYADGSPIAGAPVRLTDNPGRDVGPNWSPDGKRLAFESERDGEVDVWSMAADGTDLQNLTRTAGADETLALGGQAWGPDGRILFVRIPDPPARASPLVREDLAIAGALFVSLLLSVVVITAIRLGAPFGIVALVLAVHTVVAAIGNGEWRFLPAAVLFGLLVDIAVRFAPVGLKAAVAGAGAPAALIAAASATIVVTSEIAWSPALNLGIVLVVAIAGWGVSGVIARPAAPVARVADG
jgi:Tol biopolymer transport system component